MAEVNPLLIPLATLAACVLEPALGKISRRAGEGLAVVASALAAALSLYLFSQPHRWPLYLGPYLPHVSFYVDQLSVFMLCVINCIGALVVYYSVGYMGRDRDFIRYYALILLFIGSMSGLVVAGDLVLLYIFWEMVGICSALLIAYWWEKPEARRAGLKAFVVTRTADFGMLIGVALAYAAAGTTSVPELLSSASGLPARMAQLIGLLLFVGAMGKSAQFPLLVWLPDAMEGPTTVSALIHAATMVKAGVYLVARMYPLISLFPALMHLIAVIALITVLMSGFAAIGSRDVKRVLAFSTINHLSLMFLALGLGAWTASQLHLLSHSLFKALLFLTAGLVIHETGTRDIFQMRGLYRGGLRISAICFLIGALSLAGLPPFPGFVTKEMVLGLLHGALPEALASLVVFTVSFTSALYIFRAFFAMFLGEPSGHYHERDKFMVPVIVLLCVATTLGLYPVLSAARAFGAEHLHAAVEPLPLLAALLGVAVSYALWGRNAAPEMRRSLGPLASAAERSFLLDDAYTMLAKFVADKVSRVATMIQTGVPSINTSWILAFVLALALLVSLVW
ncbi:MAG: NADH-quinone oxidoreductase subunit L [Fervidicoccaceae archaeon]